MQTQTAVVLGGTGLIGSLLTTQLLNDAAFGTVRLLVRRPIEFTHPKLDVQLVDFNNLADYENKLGKGDCLFCCIGTTQKNVKGDNTAYRKIDFDIPVNAANIAEREGFNTYLLVSAIGANAGAGNFYLQLKGEVENAVKAAGIKSVYIFQPSMLLGKRNERRIAERIIQPIMKSLSFLFVGTIKKYKAIQASDVAKSMVACAKNKEDGVHVLSYEKIMQSQK
ncbi:NAD(P)H-binding protein [Chitinophagaceae bacterium LWZ2-11]